MAAIAARRARTRAPAETDRIRIAAPYDALIRLTPKPIVALNREEAHQERIGPDA